MVIISMSPQYQMGYHLCTKRDLQCFVSATDHTQGDIHPHILYASMKAAQVNVLKEMNDTQLTVY